MSSVSKYREEHMESSIVAVHVAVNSKNGVQWNGLRSVVTFLYVGRNLLPLGNEEYYHIKIKTNTRFISRIRLVLKMEASY